MILILLRTHCVHDWRSIGRLLLLRGNSLLLLANAEAVLADPVDYQANDADNGTDLRQPENDDPDNNLSHVAHIPVSACAFRLTKALLTAAVAALVIS